MVKFYLFAVIATIGMISANVMVGTYSETIVELANKKLEKKKQNCSTFKGCHQCAQNNCEWTYAKDTLDYEGSCTSTKLHDGDTEKFFIMNWIPSALQCQDEKNVCLQTGLLSTKQQKKYETEHEFGHLKESQFVLGYQNKDIPKEYFCSFNVTMDPKFDFNKLKTLELYLNKTTDHQVYMKINSKYNGKNITTYWNNKFIKRDTVPKVDAMFINKAKEINIVYFNKDAIEETESQDFQIHFESVKITIMNKFINGMHWGLQLLIVLIIFFLCLVCICGACFKTLKGIKKPNDDNYNDYADYE